VKISISYPPLISQKGIPLLTQNRQFQWFSRPTYIYPIVPAQAATLLSKNGYDIIWDDGIAEEYDYTSWEERLFSSKPDIIVIETKTPVIKKHWIIIDKIKDNASNINWDPAIVLVGDHVTAIPEESFERSKVDFILTGGDYDFLLLNLCNNFLYIKIKK